MNKAYDKILWWWDNPDFGYDTTARLYGPRKAQSFGKTYSVRAWVRPLIEASGKFRGWSVTTKQGTHIFNPTNPGKYMTLEEAKELAQELLKVTPDMMETPLTLETIEKS